MTGPTHRIAIFSAAFLVVTSVTIAASRYGGGLALVWFGSAIAAVMLVGLPRRRWPVGLLAIMGVSVLATSLFGFGPRLAAPLAIVNAFEAWLVARLLIALRPRRDWLDSLAGLVTLGVVGGIVAPAIAAIAGGFVASLAAPAPWYAHAGTWWAAHSLGTVIGFPVAYLASGASPREPALGGSRSGTLELGAYLLVIAAIAYLAFSQPLLPLLFLPIVPLLLAAFRCGRAGATVGTVANAATAAVSYHQPGTLIARLAIEPAQQVLFLQFYLATVTVLALPVAVALRRHRLLVIELEERKAMEQLVAEHSDDALIHLDDHGRIRYASPAGARLSGEDALVGHTLARFFDPLDDPLVRGVLADAADAPGQTCVLERPVLCGDEQLWIQAKIRAISPRGAAGLLKGYAVTIRDVSARKRTELDAIEAAETDVLTGLPNRRALIAQLERALDHADQRPFALAIFDLDHFKAINDSHGHNTGDVVLREVARLMRRLSSPSRFFARLGGEEFALVSRQRHFASAEALCHQLRRETAALEFADVAGAPFAVTVSIGLAPIAKGQSATQALQVADTLLYAAKSAGRNRVATAIPAPRPARRAA